VSEVAFIGSSLLEGCSGHNLAEAAVAGCAVLVGEHAGHFSTMADELNQAAVSLTGV
jgi:3-deoxy-D-manno-octulosonic-acid transferase